MKKDFIIFIVLYTHKYSYQNLSLELFSPPFQKIMWVIFWFEVPSPFSLSPKSGPSNSAFFFYLNDLEIQDQKVAHQYDI